ncbi:TetR/AcrR family transcriptional regulator [Aquisediminimonas sediminicola]|uniref:TetR/AcrR family transcriptional regulator n=1 Tax=Alteraquisediminimonas sediminicola TaxID=2676787 RepID=UPI001C8D5A03|nr:TetR/AcrR family transcriptional regulator [Aquisediminimonas sediminicola]
MAKTSNISRRRRSALAEGGEEYAAKRAELIEIAAGLFREKGYQSTRLADIANAAGMDRASIYYYIGSKEELFRESVEGILDTNLSEAKRLSNDPKLVIKDKIQQIFTVLMRSYEQNFPHMYVYIQEQMHQVTTEETAWSQEMLKKTRSFEAIITDLIRQGAEAGELRNDIPPRLMTNALFGMFNWTHRWFTPGGSLSGENVATAFNLLFWQGARA